MPIKLSSSAANRLRSWNQSLIDWRRKNQLVVGLPQCNMNSKWDAPELMFFYLEFALNCTYSHRTKLNCLSCLWSENTSTFDIYCQNHFLIAETAVKTVKTTDIVGRLMTSLPTPTISWKVTACVSASLCDPRTSHARQKNRNWKNS